MAHVIEVTERSKIGLKANQRCDRCGAQAYMQASSKEWDSDLLFCAHHARQHEDALMELAHVTMIDERPMLRAEEAGPRDAASAAK